MTGPAPLPLALPAWNRAKPRPPGTRRTPRLPLLAATAIAAAALAAPALAKKPPQGFQPAVPAPAAPAPATAGSIFNVNAGYAGLVEGNRAKQVGDMITIVLVEQTTTSKTVSTKQDRSGGASITPPSEGALALASPEALKASSQSSFKGGGNTTQTNSLAGEVGVTIVEVRPNGTALVRGEKRMLLSQGNEWVQFSGIVRLSDVDQQNRIRSNQVADARIEYTGNGSIQRSGREGWLSRVFNIVSPF
ncbi:MAG: flagellar basal body L-ring protein FlgH [Novosphingobium sp.]